MSTKSAPTRAAVVLLAFGLALFLAACGGASKPSETSTQSGQPAKAGTVTASETDYRIVLSKQTFTPGTYTFHALNNGKVDHALEIDGPGVADKATNTFGPGSGADLTVALQKGTYEIYCPVAGHKDLGMDLKITVN